MTDTHDMLRDIVGTGWENSSEWAEQSSESVALVSIEPAEIQEIQDALGIVVKAGHWVVVDRPEGVEVTEHPSFLSADRDYQRERLSLMRRDGADV